MEWTSLNELREKYLSYFESKGHLRLKSFSLVPQNDKSLLLINSGMAPMKKYFTGEVTPPRKRVTTCQKCIRTPDIERVGKTARHGTYFEMLGNFSFGDYFKNEATAWAWEFCTEVLELPVDRLWISIFEDDDQTFDIWTKQVGVDPSHIVRLGKEDNFWEHGAGPCGPCSELYFDRGPEQGCGSPDCKVGCDCDRFVEFWNLVFTQFNHDGSGNYTPLDHPNIDTGMGLERLACIMQGVDNLFEVDSVQNIMKHISRIAGVAYKTDEKKDVSLRVATDHIRSTTFMIGDGVLPSNEGRGYVLRRLLRRAARHGRMLGINGTFLSDVCDTVIEENRSAYPELAEKRDLIKKVISVEEESFNRTIDQGLQLLEEMISDAKSGGISGEDAFRLSDTYGFPLDLTRDIAAERGIEVNEEKFYELMKQQRERARNARKNAGADAWKGGNNLLESILPTKFVGYSELECSAKILAILKDGELCETVFKGETAALVLDTTPFYAESGGQVGDIGLISEGTLTFKVEDTQKTHSRVSIHIGEMQSGVLRVGDTVGASVDSETRRAIMRNHTAAHLLQAALRSVLGNHVEQAGQLVDADRLRFDFTHFSALTPQELKAVENAVNDAVLSSDEVMTSEMPIDEARKRGAMALFGEKYGDIVRVVEAKGHSIELCGGTHVDNTAKIALFRMVSEGSVASGVRRIEAVTGRNVINLMDEYQQMMSQSAIALKAGNMEELPQRAAQLVSDLKEKEHKIEQLNAEIAAIKFDSLYANATNVDGIKIISAAFLDTGADALRSICDFARGCKPEVIILLAGVNDGKVTFVAACGSDAVKMGAHAGNLVKEVAKATGGSGGGRPDSAMAGGKDVSRVDDALALVDGIATAQISKNK